MPFADEVHLPLILILFIVKHQHPYITAVDDMVMVFFLVT